MSLTAFLQALWTSGRVRLPDGERIADEDRLEAGRLLAEWEQAYRQELPGPPPSVDVGAAVWGAVLVYRICQLALFRQLGLEAIDRRLAEPCPAGDPARVHYSVDLTLRYLPDLWSHAHGAAEDDPLVERLRGIAARWPLSSVGIPGLAALEVDTILSHPCLVRMYVDRIIAHRDLGRCSDPRIRRRVHEALGAFPQLAPELATTVQET